MERRALTSSPRVSGWLAGLEAARETGIRCCSQQWLRLPGRQRISLLQTGSSEKKGRKLGARAVPWECLYLPLALASTFQKVFPRNKRIFQSYREALARLNQAEYLVIIYFFSSTHFFGFFLPVILRYN